MTDAFYYYPMASMEAGDSVYTDIIKDYKPLFSAKKGKELIASERKSQAAYFIMTGGTERKTLDIINKNATKQGIALIAHPGNNSLPASLEILAYLQQNGIKGRIFYLKNKKDKQTLGELKDYFSLTEANLQLKESRIGLFGAPSDWLLASMPDSETIKTNWGPEIVPVEMDDFQQAISKGCSNCFKTEMTKLIAGAKEIDGLPGSDFAKSYLVLDALNALIKKHKLDAVSVRCFDLVTDMESTGCLALANLNENGIVAGCEGDLNSTIAMQWIKTLLGKTSWMANPAQIDRKRKSMWLAHCTIARNMVGSYNLLTHFESDLGIGIQGELPKGPCTIVRIGGKDLKEIRIAECKITDSGFENNLCRTQAKIQFASDNDLSEFIDKPLGNHLTLVLGHHKDLLMQYWENFVK